MKRSNEQILDDLVNLNADQWNTLLSEELDIPIGLLKELIMARELKNDHKTKINIYKDVFKEIQSNVDEKQENAIIKDILEQSTVLDKYVVKLSNDKEVISSLSCTGKIIVGLDLYNSYLEDSYFCNCIFYNCNLSGSNLSNSVLNSCTINNCDMENADFTASTISRTKFIESNLKSALLEYSVLSDDAIIGCNINESSFRQSHILYTGFHECKVKASDFKESEFVQLATVDSDFGYSDFKRAKMCDVVLMRSNFKNCNFDDFYVTAVSHNRCKFDDKYKDRFKMEHNSNSPSIFEWEQDPKSK